MGMQPQADSLFATVNSFFNSTAVLTGLATAFGTPMFGLVVRAFRRRRRFGWNVLYDEPINQGDPLVRHPRNRDDGPPTSQNMWEIEYKDDAGPSYQVRNGSLAVIEMRNIGWEPIREPDFGEQREFTLRCCSNPRARM